MTDGIITYDDFVKVQLKVGQIIDAEDIPNADKLYKLTVDLGEEKRTICAGIKEYYSKDELLNKKVIVVVNLAPRIMRGITSQGMLLAASNEEHSKVILISPEKDIEVGSKVS
ncbi:MAG: Methionine-tRNA ligase [archaeon GW2011_AR13]|nr:MAG: Methionine-tRNA ligase [archaeon GW2011_AR13]HIG94422.1 methionine--tRNA ligase subunit beta [Nanoarchaeota archaeon]HIH62932.1 methionine--tRNA ligase subunit beta [Nanoarchaeota archaeon]HIJ10371.1 methionine--tRNA ligase subunit beta [Nanoarchaeota archaeon]